MTIIIKLLIRMQFIYLEIYTLFYFRDNIICDDDIILQQIRHAIIINL